MHERPALRWSDAPLLEWLEFGGARLAKYGFDDDDFRRVTLRGRILDSIARVFWEALTFAGEAGAAPPRTENERYIVQKSVCGRLGLHRAQAARWEEKLICPTSDTFFGALVLVLKKEIGQVGFPKNRDVAWISSRRTLGLIRRDDCRLGSLRIEPEEQLCLWYFVRHPDSGMLAVRRAPGEETSEDTITRIYSEVIIQLISEFPSGKVRTAAAMRHVIDSWIDPYTMFLAGIIRGWELIDARPSEG